MSKTNQYIIFVLIAALFVIALVVIYYDRQLDAIENTILRKPP